MPVSWDDLRRALAAATPTRVPGPFSSRAAVAAIVRGAPGDHGSERLELLFVRRAEHPRDPWSGQMAFPGGRAEPADGGDLLTTAVRETREEIGLDLGAHAEPLGALDELRAMARMRAVDLVIRPFVFRLRGAPEARASAEVTHLHWLPFDELLDPAARGLLDYTWQGTLLQFPCLRLRGVVIWGLTLRMFTSLAERLGQPGEGSAPGALP